MATDAYLTIKALGDAGADIPVKAYSYGVTGNDLTITAPNGDLPEKLTEDVGKTFAKLTITIDEPHGLTVTVTFHHAKLDSVLIGAKDTTFTLSYTGFTVAYGCYAEGTRLLTPRGEVAIEALAVGETVLTAAGQSVPIRWLGHRRVVCAGHPQPAEVWPVRVRAGAFADGQPHRDLLLSPDHAVWVDGLMIPIRRLINHVSIVQQEVAEITYWHLELPGNEIVVAEGLAAESYQGAGRRDVFAGAPTIALHPVFATDRPAPDAALVEPVWRRLAARAGVLPPRPIDATDAPRLLASDGTALRPVPAGIGEWVFALPPGTEALHLRSPAARPSDGRPWLDDRRLLGLCVRAIELLDPQSGWAGIPMDHPSLAEGWWESERSEAGLTCWTNGAAVIPLDRAAQAVRLRIAAWPPLAEPAAADTQGAMAG
jgi:hypothetical protein